LRLCAWLTVVLIALFSRLSSAQDEIITLPGDDREFAYFTLQNSLKVLLISDPDAEKAAAAVDVNVGSGDDPFDRFGLAHFLEHMLFLGTKKYPVVGEFQEFISARGGDHNAYTSLNHTNYYFDIEVNALEPALDRFAQFFISPLFLAEYVERERKAVHSEYTSKISSEARRERDVIRELVKPTHPLAKFSTGNMKTLRTTEQPSLREDLVSFYQRFYSSDQMTLVVASQHDLATLKTWVTTKFSDIKRMPPEPRAMSAKIFPDGFLPASVYIQPQKEQRILSLIFPVPDSEPYKKSKPLDYIGHILGHEGEGSVLAVLKQAGWANALSAGTNLDWRGGEAFAVKISLTKTGFEHIEQIQALVFDAIALVSKKGVNKWRYQERADLSRLAFTYGEVSDSIQEVSGLANSLHKTSPRDIYWEAYDWAKYTPVKIREYLEFLTPSNTLRVISAPEVNVEQGARSQYYDTPYRVETAAKISADVRGDGQYSALKKQLALPKRNPFIPKKFAIIGASSIAATKNVPEKIYAKHGITTWFLNDDVLDIPKGVVSARFLLPVAARDAEAFAALTLYAKVVRDSLNALTYEAAFAGLAYSLHVTSRGLDIEFYGYSDALPEFSDRIIKRINKFNRDNRYRSKLLGVYFEKVKTELLRRERNRKYDRVVSQVFKELPATLYEPYWSTGDVELAIGQLSVKRFNEIVPTLFHGAQADVFIYGNFSQRQAKKRSRRLRSLVTRVKDQTLASGNVVKLANTPLLVKHLSVDTDDNAVVVYNQGRNDSLKETALFLLLSKMVSTPFYHHLRTEQQLGYIVQNSRYVMRDVPGMVSVVQAPNHSAEEVYRRIVAFFSDAEDEILARLEQAKTSLVKELQETPLTQLEWSLKYWNSILEDDFTFDEDVRLAAEIMAVSPKDIREVFQSALQQGERRFVFVGGKESGFPEGFDASAELVRNHKKFKQEMPKFTYP